MSVGEGRIIKNTNPEFELLIQTFFFGSSDIRIIGSSATVSNQLGYLWG